MLGVLKRRWKPKRASNGSNNRLSTDTTPISGDIILEKSRITPSPHQIHPVCDEKAQLLAYENNIKSRDKPTSLIFPQTTTSSTLYPLTPNICVEGGRIEFIKTTPDGDTTPSSLQNVETTLASETPPRYSATSMCNGTSPQSIVSSQRHSAVSVDIKPEVMSRGLQVDFSDHFYDEKECLEQRVLELELALEQEHKANHKDRMAITKLQRQLARRESVQRDAERERKLRAESEVRVREAGAEATRYRTRLKYLTQEFSKMEESVRAMLAYKSRAEQLKQEKATLTLNFETKSQQYQQTINRLTEEIASLHQQLESNPPEISALEAENESLKEQVKEAHLQYEKCLDDVANQVVRALLSQKTLREEICVLTRRIEELENQNRALTSLLVQQLRSGNTSAMITPTSAREQLALEEEILNDITASLSSSSIFNTPDEEPRLRHSNSFDFDPRRHIDKRFSAGDLISSYNERVLPNGELVACISEKRLSANVLDDCTDNSLSLDDKKRHQVLADLWKELQGSEVTPQKLLNALSALESTLWTGTNSNAKRPATLDLALPNFQPARPVQRRTRPVIVPVIKPEEEAGSESPESGNRDEGYSTMSSDVQCDVNRSHSEPNRNLEDLAEATDETADSENRFIVVEDHDPDILYIPINLALRLNPRNSYPPSKDLLPFQHVMRSFSDSHLCIKITTAPSPCYSISSPISTPSVVLLDMNPLRRVRGNITLEDSWGSNLDAEWDTEYIQHWLKLDEKRLNLQQQHRDLLELEYDKAELEDWSLSLSANDAEIVTPVSVATLPSIQEGSVIELEEDVSECLWNDSSYLDRTREIEISWPYTADSPPESWSSVSEDEPCSKRSSAALSGCSDEPPAINFTRDFYRLVKFESTKSLASCSSSRGPGQKDQNHPDREQTLQNVLNFIAEQQMYCNRQDSRPSSARDFNNEAPQPQSRLDDLVWTDSFTSTESDHELYLKNELALNEQNTLKDLIPDCIVSAVENDNIESQPDVVTEVAQPRLITVPEEEETTPPTTLTESFTSTVSTPDTIVSRIPRPKSQTSSPKTTPKPKVEAPKKVIKSKIPYKHKSTVVHLVRQETQPVITSERLPQFASSVPPCSVIEGPPDRAVSFHERATSKDVIDELNRMIRKDEDTRNEVEEVKTLDSCCYPTGWVHVEKDIDFNDPKARANLLDVMLASSDSSPTSSCGGSVSSESTEDRNDYKRLHKIHRYRRQKKASALRHITSTDASTTALQTMAKIITSNTATYQMRPSIIGRNHFYVRYGDKEKEAVASFDFLQNYSTLKSCKE